MEDLHEIVTRARAFAVEAHGPQLYSGVPYVHHLDMVRRVLLRFKADATPEFQAAALLHDVIEDTPRNYSDVERAFGAQVAELVYLLTDELGRNRHERHAKTYPKIKGHYMATTLKLADRIANVEHSIQAGDEPHLSMYRREHFDFLAGVGPEGPEDMWSHLTWLMNKQAFKAPENCWVTDADLACVGCGNRPSRPYCNLSPALS